MAHICSALGIGSKTMRPFGFHILCFKNCVEFYMEKCEMNLPKQKFDHERLSYCLRKMHTYNLIHKDIKPANVLFSNTTNRLVLIDFGLSHAVREVLG